MQDALSIGEVAQRAGLATSAIRYYESIGVLPEPVRVSGQRRYGEDTLARLRFVAAAQDAGFTLREIAELGDGFNLGDLAAARLPEAHADVQRARRVQRWLEAATTCDCKTAEECALFDDAPELKVIQVAGCRRA